MEEDSGRRSIESETHVKAKRREIENEVKRSPGKNKRKRMMRGAERRSSPTASSPSANRIEGNHNRIVNDNETSGCCGKKNNVNNERNKDNDDDDDTDEFSQSASRTTQLEAHNSKQDNSRQVKTRREERTAHTSTRTPSSNQQQWSAKSTADGTAPNPHCTTSRRN